MMSKKAAAGIGVAAVLLVTLVACVFANDWDNSPVGDEMQSISYQDYNSPAGTTSSIYDSNGDLRENTLNFAVFEHYGPLLMVLAALMFGAMVGGICIAREEDDN